jgi:hypothetical protein
MLEKLLMQAKEKAHERKVKSCGGGCKNRDGFQFLYEQIEYEGHPAYSVYSLDTKKAYIKTELESVDLTFIPYSRIPWKPPTEATEYGSELELWKEIRQCIHEHLDHPEESTYDILTAWIMATWTLERWQAVGFIFAYGALETGKSRLLEILAALSFRAWLALGITEANLYRPLETWHCSLFLDEAEQYIDKRELTDLLNASYRRGMLVPRQVETKTGYETHFYDCFGFKALGGTRQLAKTLGSRCILFKMSRTTRKINLFIDEEQTTELRNKLLMYRFQKLCEESDANEAFQEEGIQDFAENVGGGRLAEMFFPLFAVAPTDELKSLITNHAIKTGQTRLEELATSDEVAMLSAIMQAYEEGKIEHGNILLKDLKFIINLTLSSKEEWTSRKVGSLCSRLGFVKQRTRQGTAIRWDSKLIDRLKKDKRYESCFTPTPSRNASLSSQTSPNWLEKELANRGEKT